MTLVDSVYRFRRQVIRRAQELCNVSQACREAGISRALFYRWRKRYLAEGADGLRPRPQARGRHPRRAPAALEDAVTAYALEFPTHGPARIAAELRRERYGSWAISPAGVYKILCRQGLSTRWERLAAVEREGLGSGLLTERTRKQLRLVRSLADRHIEAQRPGELVQIDAFYIGKLKGVGEVWQYTACDAYGSFTLIRATVSEEACRPTSSAQPNCQHLTRAGHGAYEPWCGRSNGAIGRRCVHPPAPGSGPGDAPALAPGLAQSWSPNPSQSSPSSWSRGSPRSSPRTVAKRYITIHSFASPNWNYKDVAHSYWAYPARSGSPEGGNKGVGLR